MIDTIISSVRLFANIMYILIFVRFILSWISMGRPSQLLGIIYSLTEPLLAPIRRLLDKSPLGGPGMMLDFSPIILLFFIRISENAIIIFLGALR
ncbi:MAG: YggT family protein [Defluviitaleaceae bacterium]|nr:YggT family protein [Defluviitaleaceae bacterium]